MTNFSKDDLYRKNLLEQHRKQQGDSDAGAAGDLESDGPSKKKKKLKPKAKPKTKKQAGN